jgi:integrase
MEKKKTNTPTFEEAARIVHREVAPTLKNDLNRDNWLRSLENHVFGVFGEKPVDAVDSADVLRAVGPIWTKTPDMARKTLSRIRRVMDWATIQGFRSVLTGNMTIPLPDPCSGVQVALPRQPKDGQHAALAYHEVPEFILKLRASSASVSVKLAMEFTVLTAARTSEVLEAEWKEFDIDARLMPWAFWRACSTV